MAAPVITTPEHGPMAGNGFILNATCSDASGCEELKAAPATGLSIFIDHLTINNGPTAQSITIGEGETTPGAVDAALIGPIAMAANTSLQWDFLSHGGMKLTAAKSLTVLASSTGAIAVFVKGKVG